MTTTTTRPPARRRTPQPFDPHLATIDGEGTYPETGPRLVFRCPSRRPGAPGYLLYADEDGGNPWCSCDGFTRWGHCTHATQSAEIVRLAYTNHYAALTEAALTEADRALVARLGPLLGASIRYGCLGDEVAKRARMKDPIALNLRGQRAKVELFG